MSDINNNVLYLEELTRLQADELFVKKNYIAILPLGATEQHGYHLPLGTDSFLAQELAKRVAQKIKGVVLPVIPVGYSWVWRNIPGTLTFSEKLVESIIKEVAHSLDSYGVKHLIIFSGHEANSAAMKYAVRDVSDEIDVKVVYLFYPGLKEIMNTYMDSLLWNGTLHAEEFETSLMLACKPGLVHMEKAEKEYPYSPLDFGNTALPMGDLSKSGVYGDATLATKEKGENFFDVTVKKSVEIIQYILAQNK